MGFWPILSRLVRSCEREQSLDEELRSCIDIVAEEKIKAEFIGMKRIDR